MAIGTVAPSSRGSISSMLNPLPQHEYSRGRRQSGLIGTPLSPTAVHQPSSEPMPQQNHQLGSGWHPQMQNKDPQQRTQHDSQPDAQQLEALGYQQYPPSPPPPPLSSKAGIEQSEPSSAGTSNKPGYDREGHSAKEPVQMYSVPAPSWLSGGHSASSSNGQAESYLSVYDPRDPRYLRPRTAEQAISAQDVPTSALPPRQRQKATRQQPSKVEEEQPQQQQQEEEQSPTSETAAVLQRGERASTRIAAAQSVNGYWAAIPVPYGHPLPGMSPLPPNAWPPQPLGPSIPTSSKVGPPKRGSKRSSPSTPADGPLDEPSAKKAKKTSKRASKIGDDEEARSAWSANMKKAAAAARKRGAATAAPVNMQPVVLQQPEQHSGQIVLYPELQFARCMSQRYKSEPFPRCVSCTRRWAGDTCRFQRIRYLLKDANRNVVAISFAVINKVVSTMNYPTEWNIELHETYRRRTMITIAKALLPVLRKELEHHKERDIIRRPRECEVRATCDTCMTSLFSSSWMCRKCGREACLDCFEEIKRLSAEIDPTPAVPVSSASLDHPAAQIPPSLQDPRSISPHQIQTPEQVAVFLAGKPMGSKPAHSHKNPFFLYCTKRIEHKAADFSPMTRFFKEELVQNIKAMEDLLKEVGEAEYPASKLAMTFAGPVDGDVSMVDDTAKSSEEVSRPFPKGTDVPSHSIRTYANPDELDEKVFEKVWADGTPLLVQNLLPRFKLKWDPVYFIQNYGTQTCHIVDCQDELSKKTNVAAFFAEFGRYEERKGKIYKLKDWPPSSDFKEDFPELFKDFSDAVPGPNYVRRDGVCNISSHFPTNTIAPDIGPKMYNSQASSENEGTKGSTRLHMDMADAMNIMMHTEKQPDGSDGCAVWDLFRSEDAHKIRRFLRRKLRKDFPGDPIHSQTIYLDNRSRQQLFEEEGVMSFRVYQKPGEAVFIPAGCAHQVCNLSDSIKIAIDFVSPENIERCEKLTREFRDQNQAISWKEDVLQLRSMMWFAWVSCRQHQAAEEKPDPPSTESSAPPAP